MATNMCFLVRCIVTISLIGMITDQVQGRYIEKRSATLRKHMPFMQHLEYVEGRECIEEPKMRFFPADRLKVLRDKLTDTGEISKIGSIHPRGTYLRRCDSTPSCYESRHFKQCRADVFEIATLEFATISDLGTEEIIVVEVKDHVSCKCTD